MSVVIIGGNECMTRQYKDICNEYNCNVKVYPKNVSKIKNIGSPDLMVLFTGTVSHKMIHCVLNFNKGQNTAIVRSHTSSASALRRILDKYFC